MRTSLGLLVLALAGCGATRPPGDSPDGCVPLTCAELDAECGELENDGCGKPVSCGSCQAPRTCGAGGAPNKCACESDAAFCNRLQTECGSKTAADACGAMRTVNCGSCPAPLACGEAGTPGSCSVLDARDGQRYPVVKLGTQLWFAQNLNFTAANSGCAGQPDDTVTCELRPVGRYYTWSVAMAGASASSAIPSGVRGLCPAGWHVPSVGEFRQLVTFIAQQQNLTVGDSPWPVAQLLKANLVGEPFQWKDGPISNAIGFGLVPAGLRSNALPPELVGERASLWSSSDEGGAPIWLVADTGSDWSAIPNGGPYAVNVRCVKD